MIRRWLRIAPIACILACVAVPPEAAGQTRSEWQASFTLGSDYRRYGLSQLNSGVAVQAGIDYRHRAGWFAGAGVANVDYGFNRFDTGRDYQVDAYVGYGWDPPAWDLSVAAHRYRYPGAVVGYDYSALTVGAIYRERVVVSTSYTDALLARWGPALDAEVGLIWPLRLDAELSATLGRFDARERATWSYTHWNVGLSKVYRRLGIDVRYYGSSLEEALPIGDPTGPHWVLSMSYAVGR